MGSRSVFNAASKWRIELTSNYEGLERLRSEGRLEDIDLHFARFSAGRCRTAHFEVALAAALLSAYTRNGHICIHLDALAGKPWPADEAEGVAVLCPDRSTWEQALRANPVVGEPGGFTPLILDERSRLYMCRYWEYERSLVKAILSRVSAPLECLNPSALRGSLSRLFPERAEHGTDWQKVAAATAAMKRFCVISGGPGTGKTTTVARIMALLQEPAVGSPLRIVLAAPTGKAAARLQDAIAETKRKLPCKDEVLEAIPEHASTVHRLLGAIPGSPDFKHDEKRPLTADLVIVDEASMVDLPLMAKLFRALPAKGRVILLGDKDQLASVEAGAVLGDICSNDRSHRFSREFSECLETLADIHVDASDMEDRPSGLQDCIVHLKKNYRFDSGGGIAGAGASVNEGRGEELVRTLAGGGFDDFRWRDLPSYAAFERELKPSILEGYSLYREALGSIRRNGISDELVRKTFEALDRFRILCSLREGRFGVNNLNRLSEKFLSEDGVIDPKGRWYSGKPILITRNDYRNHLFNGDVGVVLENPKAGPGLTAWFSHQEEGVRAFAPARLTEHETVFAMTVHKSQGSEFDRILMLLPDRDAPVLSRELLYTGITRARKHVEIWGARDVFCSASSRRIERVSGLRDALWTHGS
ncbi:MAG: exodeoxyribonuclease V subunit alpha [Deltaproteobacteria bacterium]|nr:exodeoxyribonuclease V subunit alpha [Deltaproteobacteria bacterium]